MHASCAAGPGSWRTRRTAGRSSNACTARPTSPSPPSPASASASRRPPGTRSATWCWMANAASLTCPASASAGSRSWKRTGSTARAGTRWPRLTERETSGMQDGRLHFARKSVGPGFADHTAGPDMVRMRGYRMGRLQAELQRRDYGGAVLYDPINIRYATGSRNMAVWTLHNPARYAFVPAAGRAVIFDFHGCEHLSDGLETIAEVRPARSWFFFASGSRLHEKAALWAAEIVDLVRERCGNNRRVAFDRLDFHGAKLLEAAGLELHDAQEPCEIARSIKSGDELACMNHAVAVCEAGMARMQEAVRPGVTENDLFAILSDTNLRMGGEWMECRLLSSGGRTNPWFQEAGDRVIRPGDLVSFDTDMIGPMGYCADISRTYRCGPGRATPKQRELYGLAMEQIQYN